MNLSNSSPVEESNNLVIHSYSANVIKQMVGNDAMFLFWNLTEWVINLALISQNIHGKVYRPT